MALSKNKIKLIQSLSKKKYRDEMGLFVAEGEKLIHQLLAAQFKFQTLIATPLMMEQFSTSNGDLVEASYDEIKKISSLITPQEVVAIFYQPKNNLPEALQKNELMIALDDIQDPGNLGTIIRLASWFGIKQVICSLKTADCYNSKVIQATMGAIAHVNIYYSNLKDFLETAHRQQIKVYGTFLEGDNIYQSALLPDGIIVMGNEGNGISPDIEKLIDHKLFIPTFATNGQNVESLNVSVAAAIICSEFKRKTI